MCFVKWNQLISHSAMNIASMAEVMGHGCFSSTKWYGIVDMISGANTFYQCLFIWKINVSLRFIYKRYPDILGR